MSSKILKVERLPDSEARIEAEISADLVSRARGEALKRLSASFSLPGFRKGALPESVLVSQLGEGQILAEAASIALDREMPTLISESKLRPIVRPSISITKLEPNAPLAFTVSLVLEPEFTLPDYKKIAKETVEADAEKRRVQMVEKIVKETKLELPKKFVEQEVDHVLSHFKHDLSHAGVSWEDYLKKAEKTEDEIRATWSEHVTSRANMEFVLAKIAEENNFKTYPEVLTFLENIS